MALSAVWHGFIEDASAGSSDAWAPDPGAGRPAWFADVIGPLVVPDAGLAEASTERPLLVVLTGGAGAIAGVASFAARRGLPLAGLVAVARDLDDLAGNVRRVLAAVDAARSEGGLSDTEVYVELPPSAPTPDWLRAADCIAEADAHFSLNTAGGRAGVPATTTVAGWIDAALDREASYRCSGGADHAVRRLGHETDREEHGFLNLLLATRLAFDGGAVTEVAELLEDRYANDLVALARTSDLAGARRWFTSFASSDLGTSLDELVGLGLLEPPPADGSSEPRRMG